MKLKLTYVLLLVILFLIIDIAVSTYHKVSTTPVTPFKDTLVMHKDVDIARLKKEKDVLTIRDTASMSKVDSSILTIRKLTNVKTTRADEEEALQWIKDYNR